MYDGMRLIWLLCQREIESRGLVSPSWEKYANELSGDKSGGPGPLVCPPAGKIESPERAQPGPDLRKKGKKMKKGQEEHRRGRWTGAGLPACAGTPLFTPNSGPRCVPDGQIDREELPWEDSYANIGFPLLLGTLNTV